MKTLLTIAFCSFCLIGANATVVFSQPHNGGPSLYQSAVNGTDYDQLTWDRFRLTSNAAIIEIRWRGGYIYGGAHSGVATNWTIAICGDIANGYQPDIINPPLARYTVSGNAGRVNAGTFSGTVMYDYVFTLPSPFSASKNQYYWILIQANQTGIPEWGIALGTGTATISIIAYGTCRMLSLDLSTLGGAWVSFFGVPWYFYAAERATNVTFTGTLQTRPVQAGPDGMIYVWDDFTDLPGQPPQAFYQMRFDPQNS